MAIHRFVTAHEARTEMERVSQPLYGSAHITTVFGAYCNLQAEGGYELVSVGYDQSGEPETVVLVSKEGYSNPRW